MAHLVLVRLSKDSRGLFSESFSLVGVVPAFLHRKDQFSFFLQKLIVSTFTWLPADKQRNVTCMNWSWGRLNPGVMYFNQGFNLSVMTIKFLLLSLTWVCLLSEYFQKSTVQTLFQVYSDVFKEKSSQNLFQRKVRKRQSLNLKGYFSFSERIYFSRSCN